MFVIFIYIYSKNSFCTNVVFNNLYLNRVLRLSYTYPVSPHKDAILCFLANGVCVHMCVCMHACVCVCVSVCVCACVCVCC